MTGEHGDVEQVMKRLKVRLLRAIQNSAEFAELRDAMGTRGLKVHIYLVPVRELGEPTAPEERMLSLGGESADLGDEDREFFRRHGMVW